MELFRGYVPTRNKQCLEKFKGVEKLKTRSKTLMNTPVFLEKKPS